MEMNTITMNQGSVSSWVPAISEVLNVITQEVKYISGTRMGSIQRRGKRSVWLRRSKAPSLLESLTSHTLLSTSSMSFVNSLTSWHQLSRGPSFFWANGRFNMFSNETVPVRLTHPGMRKYIERESGSFQMMASSWMNHQIQVHRDRVQLALLKDSSVPGEAREPWATGPTIFEVLNILSEDVNYILCNVLTFYDLSDSEFQDLAFESSLEVKQVAAEITELMDNHESIGNTVRTFLAKEYVRASIYCMVTQTSRKHYQVGAVEESRRSLHIVVDEVWDVLLKRDGGEPEEGEEVCVVQKFKDTVPARIPEITQTVVDLLFEFVTSSSIWQHFVNATWMSSEGVRSKMCDETVIEYQRGIKQDIRRVSESFLKEMSWWMSHQIQVHSERVQLAVLKARNAPPRQSNPITIPTQVPEVLVAEVLETLVAAAVSGPVCEETPTQSNPIPTQVPKVLVAEVLETLVAAAVSGSVCEETPAKRTPKRRGAIGPTISKVLNILSEDVNCILGNVLTSYELFDSEFEDLKFESSLEAGQVAGEITELMEQQRSIGSSIKTFLAKEYVKASIHRMATQTRRKVLPSRRCSREQRFFTHSGR
ncbi:hypothetical protein KUCAC02_036314 [Chaenocephalus aceratus]|nr:hypothetical protein KUCAC02_036314 [Chaenocephalus aceratus]